MKKSRWFKYSSLKECWEDNPMYFISIILNYLLSATILAGFIERHW